MKTNNVNFENSIKAYFFLTRRCNNNCPHCYINLPLNAKTEELPAESWFKIIDQLVKNNLNYLVLGGGEITIYPDLEKVYMYAKRKGMNIELMTNATNFNDSLKNMLQRYPPYKISVTIYGVDTETYTTVTGNKNGWNNFSKNIVFLEQLQKQKNTILNLTAVYTKDTIKFKEKIKELGMKYTGKKTDFIKLLYGRMDGDEERNRMIDAERLSTKQLKEIISSEKEREESCENSLIKESTKCDDLFVCHALRAQESPYFLEDGTLSYCIIMPSGKYVLKPTKEELENYDYKKMKEKLRENLQPLLELKINNTCANCTIRNRCLTCPIRNLLSGKKLEDYNEYACLEEIISSK